MITYANYKIADPKAVGLLYLHVYGNIIYHCTLCHGSAGQTRNIIAYSEHNYCHGNDRNMDSKYRKPFILGLNEQTLSVIHDELGTDFSLRMVN